ncbi:MAG: HlyD family type I secretion periplasmic adaptor subunit [Alphaproteobacteria bacterium]|nr:HlyD family type I secretion periplasmic adaptor subunit [Alphaproteobacteria bacterium]
MNKVDNALATGIRRHLWAAGIFLCALFLFIGSWFGSMQISGAVIAPGSIVVETNVQTLKHREGGNVAEILVSDGDHVDAGDLLLRLDDTLTQANLAVVTKQLDVMLATEARLIAERDQTEEISFPAELVKRQGDSQIDRMLHGQRLLLNARKAGLAGRLSQLQQQISQLGSQMDGLRAQSKAKSEEIELITAELQGLETLLEDSFVSENRVTVAKRNRIQLEGELGSLVAQTARAGLAITEREIQIIQLREDYRADVLQNLNDTRSEIARLVEQKVALDDQLSRMDIRAPRAGTIHQLAIHTNGGVVSPAEPILTIVPNGDQLVIEVLVDPNDIDQVYPDQEAAIRLPGLDRRSTPELSATIKTISAQSIWDDATGTSNYSVRLRLDDGETERISGLKLIPGMPVEAMIKTGDRTILSYLMKPIDDQIRRALREG